MNEPIFYHCPHGPHRKRNWQKFLKLAKKSVNERIKIPNLTFFTFNNKPIKCLFEKSLSSYRLPCTVLAKNWKNWNWLAKIKPLLEAIEKCETDYIVSADGFDVFITRPKDLIERFLKLNCDIIFCATPNNFPQNKEFFTFESEKYKSKNGHLNAGVFIGKRDFTLQCLREIYTLRNKGFVKLNGKFHDQAAWRYIHKKYFPRVKIDYEEKLIKRLTKP